MLAHPVGFAFDEMGRCYVAETFRMHHGVTDTRGHIENGKVAHWQVTINVGFTLEE